MKSCSVVNFVAIITNWNIQLSQKQNQCQHKYIQLIYYSITCLTKHKPYLHGTDKYSNLKYIHFGIKLFSDQYHFLKNNNRPPFQFINDFFFLLLQVCTKKCIWFNNKHLGNTSHASGTVLIYNWNRTKFENLLKMNLHFSKKN